MTLATAPDRTDEILLEIDRARRQGVLQHIVIPPCPVLLTRLQAAMAEREPDLHEVARIATSDVAMSATLLRHANSPVHAAGQPAQTIGQAMDRLGLQHATAVMTAFLLQGSMRLPHSVHLRRFWERSTKRAVAMGFLASHLPGMSTDVAHTFGLFCHVGMVVMAQSVKGYLGTVVEAHARIDRSFIATENANHRTDHAVVGALVSRLWRLSPQVTAAIRLHHDLGTLTEASAHSEVNTLVAVGLVAEYLMHRHEGLDPNSDWRCHGEAALAWLHTGVDELAAWEEELSEALDQV